MLNFYSSSRAVVSQTSDFYVNDSAGVLDNSLKNYIISTNKSLYSQTGAQIVVVTVNSLDGDAIEDYANKLFRQYGIGDSKKNNGVLILLSIQDRKCRIVKYRYITNIGNEWSTYSVCHGNRTLWV